MTSFRHFILLFPYFKDLLKSSETNPDKSTNFDDVSDIATSTKH